jgi:hypothetical protein
MAKTPSGILGKFSGKVGSVVGSTWKGRRYIREYVIPANPDTDLQKAERGLFADIVALAHALLGQILQIFWDPFLRDNSGWATFIGKARLTYLVPDNYSAVQISEGTLELSILSSAELSGSSVQFIWDSTLLGNGQMTDKAIAFVYDKVYKVGFYNLTATREDNTVSVNVGAGRTAANLIAFLFFADSVTVPTVVSPSSYAQVTT